MAAQARNSLQRSMVKMAEQEPELAGRLFVSALPAALAPIQGQLRYRLELLGVGSYDISTNDGIVQIMELASSEPSPFEVGSGANGQPASNGHNGQPSETQQPASATTALVRQPDGKVDFTLRADSLTLARLAAGDSPLKLMLRGNLRIRGKRRRAFKLRQMADDVTMREIVRAGGVPDPDLIYRAMPYAIDPSWTAGHSFCLQYDMRADDTGPGGIWYLAVDDGKLAVFTEPPASGVDSTITLTHAAWESIMRGDLTPSDSLRNQYSRVEGRMFPVTLFGRWIERAEGRDDDELAREARQRAIQGRRATWGSNVNGVGPGQGDPAVGEAKPKGVQLLSYEELYALWERQNWKAHEIDFTVDKEHWLTTPSDGQADVLWSLSSFYIGEERVAADLAPFVLAAPSGEAEVFLATQLVDEARHAAFFDRFMAEVLAVEPEDMRSRLKLLEPNMSPAWKELFDVHLRGVAEQLQADPGNMDLFVEGVTIYHLVIEGVLAMTGQHQILKYLENHDIWPGFREGFSLVEQDEHRHIAFGVRCLADAVAADERYRQLIERKIAELVPRAAHVFVPPHATDPADFVSYDYHSSEIYGFAYRALKRRMKVIGVEVPPAEELMPGPISEIQVPVSA